MISAKYSETQCPTCLNRFEIHKNRSFEIRKGYFVYQFYDAVNQFQNFNQVKCPTCGITFKAPEARLFYVFKSPYSVVFISTILGLLLMAYILMFEFKK